MEYNSLPQEGQRKMSLPQEGHSKVSLFLDTSYIVSSYFVKDTNHKKATELGTIVSQAQDLYITNYIYSEIATVLSQRIGKKACQNALEKIEEQAKVIYLSENMFRECKLEFFKQVDKNISFVDIASSLTVKENKIEAVVSFDKHFKQLGKTYGFKVIS